MERRQGGDDSKPERGNSSPERGQGGDDSNPEREDKEEIILIRREDREEMATMRLNMTTTSMISTFISLASAISSVAYTYYSINSK